MTRSRSTIIRAARLRNSASIRSRNPWRTGSRHVRIQYGEGGYGGGGFIPRGQGNRAEGGYQDAAFDEEQYVDTIPPVFEYLRDKAGFAPKLLHDVHSKMTGMNAVELARRLQPYQMFFVEDILPPEQISYYRNIRQICTTPRPSARCSRILSKCFP